MLKHKSIELFRKFDAIKNNGGSFYDEYNEYVEFSVLGVGISTRIKSGYKGRVLWAYKVIDSIFEHDTPSGKCYSIHFTDSNETIWCDNIDEVYIEIDKHFK